jgi:hypothetical protein
VTLRPDDIDLFDPDARQAPYEAHRMLRNEAPIWRMPG